MTNTDTVTIVIPTYNQCTFVKEAIESALAQDHPVKVVVSDDASTDDTPTILQNFQQKYPQLTVRLNENNRGITQHLAHIVSLVDTEFVVRLDSDDVLRPNYVSTLIGLLKEHPDAGYAHAAVQEIDGDSMPTKTRVLFRSTGYQSADDALRRCISGYSVAANILAFRTKAIQQVNYGLLPFNYVEDYYGSIVLADKGWGNVYSSQILSNYRVWRTDSVGGHRRTLNELRALNFLLRQVAWPAFERRGWSAMDIERACAERAANATRQLAKANETERLELLKAIKELSSDPSVLRQIWLIEHGFDGVLSGLAAAKQAGKAAIKAIIRRGR